MTRCCSRRALLRAGAAAGLAALAGCPSGGADSDPTDAGDGGGGDAAAVRPDTIFRADIERTGHWPDQSVPDDVGVEWAIPGINKGDHTAAKASPLVYRGDVIAPGDVSTVFSFSHGGDLNWATALHPSGFGTHATPAIADGTLYTSGYDGAVYAIDTGDGEMQWRRKISDAIGSSPAYYDGRIYIATEFYDPSGGMAMLDAATGEVLWEDFRMTNHAHSITGIDPERGVFAAGCNDGRLYVWELGQPPTFRGAFDTGEPIKGPVCMHDGRAIFGSWDDTVYAVDLETLEADWRYETGGDVMAGAALHPDTGVAVIGSGDDYLHAIDLATGDRRWRFETGGYILGSPVVAGDTVLAGSYDSTLYAVRVEDGTERWAFDDPEGFITASPAVHDGDIYVTARATDDTTGHLYKLTGM
jgi:outer membrane protein assembly factor BamB